MKVSGIETTSENEKSDNFSKQVFSGINEVSDTGKLNSENVFNCTESSRLST